MFSNSSGGLGSFSKLAILCRIFVQKIEKPKQEEIDNIINNKLKNNKAPGDNSIEAELLKKGGAEIRREIMEMISII